MNLKQQIKTGALIVMVTGTMLVSGCSNSPSNPEDQTHIIAATGSTLTTEAMRKENDAPLFDVRDYGAEDQGNAVTNTAAFKSRCAVPRRSFHEGSGGTASDRHLVGIFPGRIQIFGSECPLAGEFLFLKSGGITAAGEV